MTHDRKDTAPEVVIDVLMVEDDAELRTSVVDLLTEWGFAARSAANGREALEALASGLRPRLLLLDLHMPVVDGRQFLVERAKSEALSAIPVVVMTAENERPLNLPGVTQLLEKPVRVERLLAAVREGRAAGARTAAKPAA